MISLNKYAMIVGSMTILLSGVIKAEDERKSEVVVTDEKESAFSKKIKTLKKDFDNSELKKVWRETTKQENINWLINNKNALVDQTKKIFTQCPMHIPAISLMASGWLAAKLGNANHLSKEELLKCLKNKGNRHFGSGVVLGTVYLFSNYTLTSATNIFTVNEKNICDQKTDAQKVIIEEFEQSTN